MGTYRQDETCFTLTGSSSQHDVGEVACAAPGGQVVLSLQPVHYPDGQDLLQINSEVSVIIKPAAVTEILVGRAI